MARWSWGCSRLVCAEEQREPLGIRYEVTSVAELSLFPAQTCSAVVSSTALRDCAERA